jgi:hypothetical protein
MFRFGTRISTLGLWGIDEREATKVVARRLHQERAGLIGSYFAIAVSDGCEANSCVHSTGCKNRGLRI